MSIYEDHFSAVASGYGRFRPTYPEALFWHLGTLTGPDATAWEVGAGSGQATAGLRRMFPARLVSTDASAAQLREMGGTGVHRVVCLAESAPLSGDSVDLIAVAQALHWLDHRRFFQEVGRVAKPGAILAAWTYGLPEIEGGLDTLVRDFALRALGPFWPAARRHVESRYADIDFPFEELPAPRFRMEARLGVEAFLGYVRTWSAVTRALAERDRDPVAAVEAKWRARWGHEQARSVRWPVTLRTFRVREG